jgi:hypothetical protein
VPPTNTTSSMLSLVISAVQPLQMLSVMNMRVKRALCYARVSNATDPQLCVPGHRITNNSTT